MFKSLFTSIFTRKKGSILVVGSVHLDIYATHTDEETQYEDRPGEVRLSWGGAALNIAINLSDRYQVHLNSVVYQNRQIISSLVWLLKRCGVQSAIKFIKPARFDDESIQCHVAITNGHSVREAVTQTLIEREDITKSLENSFKKRPKLVVADTNLSVSQLCCLLSLCESSASPLVVVGVTQQKAPRFTQALAYFTPKTRMIFVCNAVEYKEIQLQIESSDGINNKTLDELVDYLVVTQNKSGYSLYSKSGKVQKLRPPQVSAADIKFDSGAGDALACAIAACLMEDDDVTPNGMEKWVQHYVPMVLGSYTAHAMPETKLLNRALAIFQRDPNSLLRDIIVAMGTGLLLLLIQYSDLSLITDLLSF